MKKIFTIELLILLCFANCLHAQSFEWVKQFGAASSQAASGIALDKKDNVYTTGIFRGTVDFDPGLGPQNVFTLSSINAGRNDIFISKLDAAGNFVWAKQIGGGTNSTGNFSNAVAVDDSGYIYIVGRYSPGTVDFDPGPLSYSLTATSARVFILKLDSAGNFVWAKNINATRVNPLAVKPDNHGNVYVGGESQGATDFGSIRLAPQGTYINAFICKLNPVGNFTWARHFEGKGNGFCNGLDVDTTGGVYAVGTFTDTFDFDPGSQVYKLTSVYNAQGPKPDIFVSKLDSSGKFVWATSIGKDGNDLGSDIAIDNKANVYIAGRLLDDTITVDQAGSQVNASNYEVLVTKLNATGNILWSKIMATAGGGAEAIGIDSKGNILATGNYGSYLQLNTTASPDSIFTNVVGSSAMFVLKLDSSGKYRNILQIEGSGSVTSTGIAIDATDAVYTSGYFTLSADFDPGPKDSVLTSLGLEDAFVHKMVCKEKSAVVVTATTDSCNSYTLNGQTYTASGNYTQVLTNTEGCDSIINLSLTITNNLNLKITQSGQILNANAGFASYKWLKDGNIIAAASGANHTITTNGEYKVIATTATGCTDTSDAIVVTDDLGVLNILPTSNVVRIYPNPATDIVTIDAPKEVDVLLSSLDGKTVYEEKNAHSFSVKLLAGGIYFLRIYSKEGTLLEVSKLVVSTK